MSYTETDICNQALDELGHNVISDINTDTQKAGDLCRRQYPRCRDSLLQEHPWNFAIRRVELAQETATPSHEYTYQYALPVDCLRVIRTNWEANGFTSNDAAVSVFLYSADIPWRIEGRKLLTNESSVKVEYIAKVTDTSQFTPMFVDLLATKLALMLAMPLTDNGRLVQSLDQIYQRKLMSARTMDAQEGSPRDIVDTSGWVQARF